jgi:plasmid stabilization system protein ParE
MTKVKWTPQATDGLEAIADFIAQDSPHYASLFVRIGCQIFFFQLCSTGRNGYGWRCGMIEKRRFDTRPYTPADRVPSRISPLRLGKSRRRTRACQARGPGWASAEPRLGRVLVVLLGALSVRSSFYISHLRRQAPPVAKHPLQQAWGGSRTDCIAKRELRTRGKRRMMT